MLKQFFALVRGRSYEAAETVVDRNALTRKLRFEDLRDERRAPAAGGRGLRFRLERADGRAARVDGGAQCTLAHVVALADLCGGR